MQAGAQRRSAPGRERSAVQEQPDLPLAAAADIALLDALPIAAAVIARLGDGRLSLLKYNRRFAETVEQSTCTAIDYGDADCLRDGPIAGLLQQFFGGGGGASELEIRDGEGVAAQYFRIRLAPLPCAGDAAPRCLLSLVDRTVEVQSERNLRGAMLRDGLTGLPNRLAFSDAIEQAGAGGERGGGGKAKADHAVLVVDMLRFSRINQSMGALAGDELLITFARRLISALRVGDVLARTGGNEFGLLVSLRNGVSDALTAASRIQQAMTAPFRLSELEIKVECAIGVALMHGGENADELFRSAQFAVKQAKAAGSPQIYEPREASAVRRRFSIETELRRALDKDELDLFYQPMVDLQSGEVAGFEALARRTHPDRGEISPSEFIAVAEESGLILTLGRWAIDKAVHRLAQWDKEAGQVLPLTVAANLSAIQLARDNVAGMVATALQSSGLRGERLCVELTESAIVQDPERAIRVFEALKALDISVAMDDFGTGYSSLASLQKMPIDLLKIDRSFVSGMMSDRDSVAIVRAVLSLADALGMATIAEGVESVELATTLAALGCSFGQGYYFAKPLEAEAAIAYWKSRRR